MARTTTQHTIVVHSAKQHGVTIMEAIGTGSILPGDLLAFNAGGKVVRHPLAGSPAIPLIALEIQTPDTVTYPTTAKIDIPYSDGDLVYFAVGQAGDIYNMWLDDGATVKKGKSVVISDGAGRIQYAGTGIAAIGTTCPVGYAWKTVNNSAGGTSVRCPIMIA